MINNANNKDTKVFVAMSGGVDFFVVAVILFISLIMICPPVSARLIPYSPTEELIKKSDIIATGKVIKIEKTEETGIPLCGNNPLSYFRATFKVNKLRKGSTTKDTIFIDHMRREDGFKRGVVNGHGFLKLKEGESYTIYLKKKDANLDGIYLGVLEGESCDEYFALEKNRKEYEEWWEREFKDTIILNVEKEFWGK